MAINLDEALCNSDYRNIVLSVFHRFSQSKNLDKKAMVDLCIWRAVNKYQKSHSSGAGFTTYLWNVAKNTCLKDNKFENYPYSVISNELCSSGKNMIEQLNDLGPESKAMLEDRYLGNLTLKEIGKKYKMSKESARRIIKTMLRQMS